MDAEIKKWYKYNFCLQQHFILRYVTVNGNQNHQPIKGWIQNHSENQSEKNEITLVGILSQSP